MYLMKVKSLVLSVFIMLAANGLVAQQLAPAPAQSTPTEFTQDQLRTFVEVSQEINGIQQEAQTEMVAMIEKEGLDVNKFNEMAAAQRNPQADTPNNFSNEEQMAFQNAMQNVQTMQVDLQNKMQQAIEVENMDMKEYQQIMQAYQQSPEIQQQVNEMMEQK